MSDFFPEYVPVKTGKRGSKEPTTASCLRCRKPIGAGNYDTALKAMAKHQKKCLKALDSSPKPGYIK